MASHDTSTSPLSNRHFEDVLLSAVHSIEEAIVITDFKDRMLFANRAFETLTGFRTGELMGEILYRHILPEEEWADMESRNEIRQEGKNEWYEIELIRKDGGRRKVLSRGMALLDDDEKPIGTVGVMTDVETLQHLEGLRTYLEDEFRADYKPEAIVGSGSELKQLLEQAHQVAPGDTTVLIEGESGTGKELIAHSIHQWSKRRSKTLIKVNCAAIPHELFESEFFGHKKGAFTGATSDKIGRFELADKGSLFLDEIGELPLEQQGKLLRALQEGEVQRVGEEGVRKVDVRLIAATNRDLAQEVKAKRFREDLFYRLNVFPLHMPPLRRRTEDIPDLTRHFVAQSCRKLGRPTFRISPSDLQRLREYAWPGNIRELQNVIERSVILSRGRTLTLHLDDAPEGPARQTEISSDATPANRPLPSTLEELETLRQELVLQALADANGKIYGDHGAAKALGLKPSTLQSQLKRWGYEKGYQKPAR